MKRRLAALTLVISTFALALPARAAEPPQVLKLSDGVTSFQLSGVGLPAMAVLAHRANFNAHSFDVFSLYIKDAAASGDAPAWQSVSIFDGDTERLNLTVSGGADCLLHDFRLVSSARPLQLVVAERELGQSYANAHTVTFSFYTLRKNSQAFIGRPLYYFERTGTQRAARSYCDVGDAFKNELGMERYGARANAP